MLIDELREHLENTPLEELREEWKLLKEFEDTSPTAIDLINYWKKVYYDIEPHGFNVNLEENKNIIETPNYSEFFFNIALWKTKYHQLLLV